VRTIATASILGLLALAVPARAFAVQRYASPGGSGTICSQPQPCDLVTAVNGASGADEVIVPGDQGTYGTTSSPITTQLHDVGGGVNVHGVSGEPMPMVYMNVPGDNALVLNSGGTVTYLHIENLAASGSGAFIGTGADHLYASGGSQGCEVLPSTAVSDSVCAGGATGIGVSVGTSGSQTTTLNNVTVIGGTSFGISLDANGFNWNVFATNVIARGGFQDIATSRSNAGTITFALDHSNYANVSAGAGTTITAPGTATNQTALPVFVDAANGNFRQAPTSPTIDHGVESAFNGVTDLEGKPRIFGAHTDIGADEYAPPSVLSESATSITTTSVILGGVVNTEGGGALARIDYGATPAYGSSIATNSPTFSALPQLVAAALAGLQPGTTYHYRVAVANGSGTVYGADQTFTTPSVAAAPTHKRKCRKKRHKQAAAAKKHKCKKHKKKH
jgi:hypothetical protein